VTAPSSQRASRAVFWARLRRSLWQPPRPHGEQPRERVVGPLELFYDLAVVVLVAQAAHHLAEHLTWPGLGEFAAVFTLVWIAWANGSLHHELHGHDDARARSTFLLQILLLVAMAMTVTDSLTERFRAFIIIVLGETLTGVVGGLASQPVSALTMAVGLVAVVVGFGAWWTYFDFAGQRRPRPEPVPTCNGYSAICRLRPLSPRWAPRWSASSTTPMTAEPQRPRRGS
jgi:low temperature requirement protein LtrA